MRAIRLILVCFILSPSFSLLAKLPDSLTAQSEITLLTIYPGHELYSTFGHSAIRIEDPFYGLDRIYNYGTFSFEEPGFYTKFVKGLLNYQLSAYHYEWAEHDYKMEERPIVAQHLRLNLVQRNIIYRFLENNYLPANRRYLYDFFLDNCATRIRDVFEITLGTDLHLYFNEKRKLSFRQYLDIYLDDNRWSDYGMDLGLGNGADRIATPRESLFLPEFLYESFEHATIDVDGQRLPFVLAADTLLWIDGADTPAWEPPWPLIFFSLLALFILWRTLWQYRAGRERSRGRPWMDIILYSIVGIAGVLILFLWFGTNHKVTPDNWDLLWAWPTHLAAAGLMLFKKRPDWLPLYFGANAVLMLITVAGWPFWPQDLHEANIPLVIALGARSAWQFYAGRA